MPSSRTCPAPTGPKLLTWTWVGHCPGQGGRGWWGGQTPSRHFAGAGIPLHTSCQAEKSQWQHRGDIMVMFVFLA